MSFHQDIWYLVLMYCPPMLTCFIKFHFYRRSTFDGGVEAFGFISTLSFGRYVQRTVAYNQHIIRIKYWSEFLDILIITANLIKFHTIHVF